MSFHETKDVTGLRYINSGKFSDTRDNRKGVGAFFCELLFGCKNILL